MTLAKERHWVDVSAQIQETDKQLLSGTAGLATYPAFTKAMEERLGRQEIEMLMRAAEYGKSTQIIRAVLDDGKFRTKDGALRLGKLYLTGFLGGSPSWYGKFEL